MMRIFRPAGAKKLGMFLVLYTYHPSGAMLFHWCWILLSFNPTYEKYCCIQKGYGIRSMPTTL